MKDLQGFCWGCSTSLCPRGRRRWRRCSWTAVRSAMKGGWRAGALAPLASSGFPLMASSPYTSLRDHPLVLSIQIRGAVVKLLKSNWLFKPLPVSFHFLTSCYLFLMTFCLWKDFEIIQLLSLILLSTTGPFPPSTNDKEPLLAPP